MDKVINFRLLLKEDLVLYNTLQKQCLPIIFLIFYVHSSFTSLS